MVVAGSWLSWIPVHHPSDASGSPGLAVAEAAVHTQVLDNTAVLDAEVVVQSQFADNILTGGVPVVGIQIVDNIPVDGGQAVVVHVHFLDNTAAAVEEAERSEVVVLAVHRRLLDHPSGGGDDENGQKGVP